MISSFHGRPPPYIIQAEAIVVVTVVHIGVVTGNHGEKVFSCIMYLFTWAVKRYLNLPKGARAPTE
jgi:hypothetical protein